MTSLWRNLTVLLLFLSASSLFHSCLFSHAAPTSPSVTLPRILFLTGLGSDDYNEYDEDDKPIVAATVKVPKLFSEPQFCKYDPCSESYSSCDQLSKETGCLCPGVSGADQPPHAPRIQTIVPITVGTNSGKVEVHWCAPSSVVSGYRVLVDGEEAIEFGHASRQGLVGFLEVGTKVCVEAFNKEGSSEESEFSCKRYDKPQSGDHHVMAAILGGGIALLVIILIAGVVIWRHQISKKAKRDSADGLRNPSFSTAGTL